MDTELSSIPPRASRPPPSHLRPSTSPPPPPFTHSFLRLLRRSFNSHFHITTWLPLYTKTWRSDLKLDVIGGLSVGALLLPQGIAYAILAGLPPVYGLYSSLVPSVMYFLTGTCPQLSVAPAALTSVILASSVSGITPPNTPTYIQLALAITLLKGAMSIAMGLLNLGYAAAFISQSVLTGFTSAAATIIATSQIESLLGLDAGKRNDYWVISMGDVFKALPSINWLASLIGIVSLSALFLLKKIRLSLISRFRHLIVTVLATVTTYLIYKFSDARINIVGDVPSGLIPPRLPDLDGDLWIKALVPAFLLTIVGFLESIAIEQKYAQMFGYTIDPNQEFFALGLSNFVGSFFGSFAVTGSFSRTAVYASIPTKSQFSQLITCSVVLAALLGFTEIFFYIPKCVLAAVIIAATVPLFEVDHFIQMWRINKHDFFVACIAFWATLLWSIQWGLILGIVMSLGMVLYQISRPPIVVLGEVAFSATAVDFSPLPSLKSSPASSTSELDVEHITTATATKATNNCNSKVLVRGWKNVDWYSDSRQYDGILVLRLDSPLFFGNCKFFENRVRRILARVEERSRVVVGDGTGGDANLNAWDGDEEEMADEARGVRPESEGDEGDDRKSDVSTGRESNAPINPSRDSSRYKSKKYSRKSMDQKNPRLTSATPDSFTMDVYPPPASPNNPYSQRHYPPARIEFLVLDCSSVNSIDFDGCMTLIGVSVDLRAMGIQFLLAGIKSQVRSTLHRAGAFDPRGGGHGNAPTALRLSCCFMGVEGAVRFARQKLRKDLQWKEHGSEQEAGDVAEAPEDIIVLPAGDPNTHDVNILRRTNV